MRLSIGIVGLPNAGKSTLFNALTGAGALAASYPFATIDPNTGIVPIPDPRLPELAGLFGSPKHTPAAVTFVDIAGLVRGASRGEGLGNRFLANIRDVDAVCHVVRAFAAPGVAHVDDEPGPARDMEAVEAELVAADLETIDRRLAKLDKEATADPGLRRTADLLHELREVAAAGKPIAEHPALTSGRDEPAKDLAGRRADHDDLRLLTAKPVIYVFNCDEEALADPDRRAELAELTAPASTLFLNAQIEAELMELEAQERAELLESVGQGESGLDAVIRAAYVALGLQSFLTGNEQETRAWTIRAGSTAPEAAGEIHTDFQRGFIAAEVIDYDLLIDAGSWGAARARGLIRTEGKGYVMQPDDVVLFRFNV